MLILISGRRILLIAILLRRRLLRVTRTILILFLILLNFLKYVAVVWILTETIVFGYTIALIVGSCLTAGRVIRCVIARRILRLPVELEADELELFESEALSDVESSELP